MIKPEYILIKRANAYMYARFSQDTDTYVVMADVGEKEGREIVARANTQSDFNKQQEELQNNTRKKKNG